MSSLHPGENRGEGKTRDAVVSNQMIMLPKGSGLTALRAPLCWGRHPCDDWQAGDAREHTIGIQDNQRNSDPERSGFRALESDSPRTLVGVASEGARISAVGRPEPLRGCGNPRRGRSGGRRQDGRVPSQRGSGRVRMRWPVAWAKALAIAGAVPIITGSARFLAP